VEGDIHIEKASGHGLGYLFAPMERKKSEEDEETPQWVLEGVGMTSFTSEGNL
jgi:hypothetical protein